MQKIPFFKKRNHHILKIFLLIIILVGTIMVGYALRSKPIDLTPIAITITKAKILATGSVDECIDANFEKICIDKVGGKGQCSYTSFEYPAETGFDCLKKINKGEKYYMYASISSNDPEVRNTLEKLGFKYLQYLGETNWFVVSVKQNDINITEIVKYVEGLGVVKPQDKFTPRIYRGEIPDYAMEEDYLLLSITTFEEPTEDVLTQIKDLGGEITKTQAIGNKVDVRIHKDTYLKLGDIHEIRYISTIPPPIINE